MFRFITIIYSKHIRTLIHNYLKYVFLVLVILTIIISYICLIQSITNRYEYTLDAKNDDNLTELNEKKNNLGDLLNSDNPSNFTLSTNKNIVCEDGIFTLSWTASVGADNYSVYSSTKNITKIDGDSILVKSNVTRLSYSIIASDIGVLYYVVVAYNKSGNTLSNCIKVQIIESEGSSDRNSLGGDLLSVNFFFIPIFIIAIILLLSFSGIMSYKAKRRHFFEPKYEEFQDEGIQEIRNIKHSEEILYDTIDNSNLLNSIEEGKDLSKFKLSSFSADFLHMVDKFKWNSESQKGQFIKEMVTLTPEERDEIINYMGEKSNNDDFTH